MYMYIICSMYICICNLHFTSPCEIIALDTLISDIGFNISLKQVSLCTCLKRNVIQSEAYATTIITSNNRKI